MKQEKLFYFARGILSLLIIAGFASSNLPENPCPEIFQYKFDGIDWIGLIQLDNVTKDESVNIIVELSVPISLPTDYKGRLNVLEEHSIFQNKQFLYKITFPVQNPIARVTNINVNNVVLCDGPPDKNPEMTSFHLYHVFYPNRSKKPNDMEESSILYPMVSITTPSAEELLKNFLNNLLDESRKVAEETPA